MKNLKTVMATTAVLLASLPVFAQVLVKIGFGNWAWIRSDLVGRHQYCSN